MRSLKQRYDQLQSFIAKNEDKIAKLKCLLRQATSKKEFNAIKKILGVRLNFSYRLADRLANIEDDLKHAPKHILVQEFKNKLKGFDLSNAGERDQLSHEIKRLDEELKGNGATHDELLDMGWCELYFKFS